jgi:hypothetical protein
MQCPRCGLQNAAGATQCIRCAYSLTGGSAERSALAYGQPRPAAEQTPIEPGVVAPQGVQSGYGSQAYETRPPPEPTADGAGALRRVAVLALALAALAALVYGGWAMTARRALFTELPDGTVSLAEAKSSDRLDAVLMWTAVALIVIAVVLWLAVHRRRRHPLGSSGFTAMALLGTGLILVAVGAYTTSLVGDVSDADRAALGFLIMGLGFVLVAAGCVAAILAVYSKPPMPLPSTPAAGFAGWQRRP